MDNNKKNISRNTEKIAKVMKKYDLKEEDCNIAVIADELKCVPVHVTKTDAHYGDNA